jgi:ribosomal-protein-alanine N-acetyltransferase
MSMEAEQRVEMVPMSTLDLDAVLAIEFRVCAFPWGRGNFADSLASNYNCWVCRVNGELVGYFVIMLVLDEAHLLTISVSEKRQKQGLGARLLHHAMHVARQNGAKTLLLEVRPSNRNALGLYRHFGFQQIGVRRGYYPAEQGREDALVLTRALYEVLA